MLKLGTDCTNYQFNSNDLWTKQCHCGPEQTYSASLAKNQPMRRPTHIYRENHCLLLEKCWVLLQVTLLFHPKGTLYKDLNEKMGRHLTHRQHSLPCTCTIVQLHDLPQECPVSALWGLCVWEGGLKWPRTDRWGEPEGEQFYFNKAKLKHFKISEMIKRNDGCWEQLLERICGHATHTAVKQGEVQRLHSLAGSEWKLLSHEQPCGGLHTIEWESARPGPWQE